MGISKEDVRQQVASFLNVLTNMQPKDKSKIVSHQVADNFNKILEFAKEVAPHVDARLWPSPVIMVNGNPAIIYIDLEIFANQLIEHFPMQIGIAGYGAVKRTPGTPW